MFRIQPQGVPVASQQFGVVKYAIRSDFENQVITRHREASRSRDRRKDEPEPGAEAVSVLSNYWRSKEAPYETGIVPMPLPATEGILDLDLLYDSSPHDGLETPFVLAT